MKRNEFAFRLHHSMEPVQLSLQLKHAALDRIAGKEQPVMKKKMSAALVLVLILCLLMAAAVAAAHRAGLLDFVGHNTNSYVPEDAQSYVQTDVATMENQLVTAAVREMYFDGKVIRAVVDVTPKENSIMLLGSFMYPGDLWSDWRLQRDEDGEADSRTVAQVYQDGRYKSAYTVGIDLYVAEHDLCIVADSMDCFANEDGTLTIYQQKEYENVPEDADIGLHMRLIPWEVPLMADSKPVYVQRQELEQLLPVSGNASSTEAYVCTQPVEVPSAGVRIDGLLIEVKPQELYATLAFTVTDRAAYDALDGGLWFEFIDPDIFAEMPYEQRLMSGLSDGGSIGPVKNDDPDHLCQKETLGRNELHQVYNVRAFNAGDKERYETVQLVMRPASPEDVAAFLAE